MKKLLLLLSFVAYLSNAFAQPNMLSFKKRSSTIQNFFIGEYISFQTSKNDWKKGEITKMHNDSFFIKTIIVTFYMMGSDTFYYPEKGYSIADVYAMPKKGYLIDYVGGRFQVSRSGGSVHFVWIKNGWALRAGALGFAGLHISNGFIDKDYSFNATSLSIAGGTYLVGKLLKKYYKPTWRIKNKFHLKIINFSN